MKDNFGNLWLIDAYDTVWYPILKKVNSKATWKAIQQRQTNWECGVFCHQEMELGELFEDDDDYNPNIVMPGVKIQRYFIIL